MANYNGKSIPTDGSKDIITWSEEQKTDIQSALNGVTKSDVGLDNVLNERQAYQFERNSSTGDFRVTFPTTAGQYLVVSSWNVDNTSGMWIVSIIGGTASVTAIKEDGGNIVVTKEANVVRFAKSFQRLFTVTRLY